MPYNCQIRNIPGRENHLQENYKRHWMKCGNIIHDLWMWIPDNLGFSRCAVPLYVVVVIFRKRMFIGSGI